MDGTSTQYVQIQATFPTAELAYELAVKLVREKLVACAQVGPIVQSFYTWKGSGEMSKETILLAKTSLHLFDRVESIILEAHPYECPQIIALPIITANAKYLDWLKEQLE